MNNKLNEIIDYISLYTKNGNFITSFTKENLDHLYQCISHIRQRDNIVLQVHHQKKNLRANLPITKLTINEFISEYEQSIHQ